MASIGNVQNHTVRRNSEVLGGNNDRFVDTNHWTLSASSIPKRRDPENGPICVGYGANWPMQDAPRVINTIRAGAHLPSAGCILSDQSRAFSVNNSERILC